MIQKINLQPHPRILIRKKIIEILKDNIKIDRWFTKKPDFVMDNDLPCGLVYINDEPVTSDDTNPRTYKRDLQIFIQFCYGGNSIRIEDAPDFLDSRAFEVENIFSKYRDLELPKFVEDVILVNTVPDTVYVENNYVFETIKLGYLITYYTNEDMFANGYDDYLSSDVKILTTDNASSDAIFEMRV